MLRLLSPPLHDKQGLESRINATRRATEDARIEAARNLCRRYLKSGVSALLRKIPPESNQLMENSLHACVLKAAKISYSLWVQKKDLACTQMAELPEEFRHDHPLLEAHQLHSKYLDENPARLDGMPILVVTHPAVIRYGTGDGLDHNLRVVLKKAICWMGDRPGWKRP